MSNVFKFISRKDLTARQNLNSLIDIARDTIQTWSDVEGFSWDAARWPTTHRAIRFINEENKDLHPSVTPNSAQLMDPVFTEFAKAYLRYRHHTEPHRNVGREMAGLRAIEYVLRKDLGTPDITKVSQRHFDEAIVLISNYKSAPFIAGELLNILKRLADFSIVTSSAHYWEHRFVGGLSYENTNGAFAPKSIKDKKLPAQDALLAIGEVFSRGYDRRLDDIDILVTSLTATLLSAPMRIGEFVRFRADCLAKETDKDGNVQHYLKYWVPKTRDYARKPIPTTMAETAIEAIDRLFKITNEGRRLAGYMEENPTRFYRHPNCPNVPDDQVLSREQVAQALGYASRKSVEDYINKMTGSRKLTGHTLDSLWQIVLKDHMKSNPHFPYQERPDGTSLLPLKMSESLLCCLRNQFSVDNRTSPVLLAPFNRDYYSKRLDGAVKSDRKNIRPLCFYTRHGFEPMRLKSHSPRHLLNRLAKQNGVSTEVLTAWSSRSSQRQTLTYLDTDRGEAASATASMMAIEGNWTPKDPVIDDEAEIYKHGPIHRSRYGLCRRSWRIGPCNKFADCLNCSELLMCKGDNFAAATIAAERDSFESTYRRALTAAEDGEQSASRWMKLAETQIKKLDELLSILNDPAVPDGSPIEISGADFSHEHNLVERKRNEAGVRIVDRTKLAIEYSADLLACLDELKSPKNA